MTKVKFIFCDNVEVIESLNHNVQYQITNPIEFIRLKTIPTYFSISMLIVLKDVLNKEETQLTLKIKNPNNVDIYDSGRNPIKPIPSNETFNVNVDLKNLFFDVVGDYKVQLFLDDNLTGEDYFTVLNE